MSSTIDPEENHSPHSIRQNVDGNQNQVMGNVTGSSVYHISETQSVTIHASPGVPSTAEVVKSQPLIPRSPYMGLRRFEIQDKALFFGRDQLIDRLLDRLNKAPFLVILGASGSGKSSLIRAGLIPRLSDSLKAGCRDFICTPDRDPFDSFRTMLRSAGYRQSELESLQTNEPETLTQVVRSLKPADEDWLIFIDQFEELFTLCQSLQKRQAFINGLIRLVQSRLLGVRLILAMRADFLDRLSAYPQLSNILQRCELVTDIGDSELRLAIEKPAERHGVVLEPGLTEEIIHDLKGKPSTPGEAERVSLPLLQYTLKLLWNSSGDLSDRTLRIQTYRDLGGVQGALQRHVDEIYAPLPEAQKQAVKHIFLHLIDTTSADAGTTAVGKAISRRAFLNEFGSDEQEVLYQFVDAGLLVSSNPHAKAEILQSERLPSDYKATVELAHETLIDAWDTLKAWIEESRPLLRLNNQLKEDAHRWYDLYQSNPTQAEAELWQGSKLQRLLAQRQDLESRFGEFKPEQAQFTQACEELSDRTRRREVRRLRRTIVGVSSSLVVATGLAIFAGYQWLRADQEQIFARSQASQAQFALNPNTIDSLLEALRASEDYLRLPKLLGSSSVKSNVMQSLAQSVYWVKEMNRLDGHTAPIRWSAFSPDGQTIATASEDNTVRLWTRKGQLLPVRMSHAAPVISVAFSQDGKLIASGSDDGSIKLWTVQGQLIKEILHAHNKWVHSVSFDPQGRFFASSSEDGDVKLWDLQGNPLQSVQTNQGAVRSIAFSPDGETLATGGEDGSVKLWTSTLQEKGILRGHLARVRAVSYSRKGDIIATASQDGTVRLWNSTGEPIITFPANNEGWGSVAFSADDRWIAASSRAEEGLIQIWDREGNPVIRLEGHSERVNSASFSPASLVLASVSTDQSLRLWDLSSSLVTVLDNYGSDNQAVLDVSFAENGHQVAAALKSGEVEVWDWRLRQSRRFQGHTAEVRGVSISPKGDRVASASLDGNIRFWSLVDEQQIPPILNAHEGGANSVQFSPQGDYLVSGGSDEVVKVWNLQGQLLNSLVGHTDPITRVRFSPDGKTIATASMDKTVRLWNTTGGLKHRLEGHQEAVWDVAFSPKGNLIATGGSDGQIILWNENGQLLNRWFAHDGSVNGIVFDPTGERIFSVGDNTTTIRVWQRNGTLVATLTGHKASVYRLSFAKEGAILASSSSDGKVIVWQTQSLTLPQLHELGCQWAKDFLTYHSNSVKLCSNILKK